MDKLPTEGFSKPGYVPRQQRDIQKKEETTSPQRNFLTKKHVFNHTRARLTDTEQCIEGIVEHFFSPREISDEEIGKAMEQILLEILSPKEPN